MLRKVRFDLTITLGNIISMCVGATVMVAAWYNLKYETRHNDEELARQRYRIENLEQANVRISENQNLISKNLEVITALFKEHARSDRFSLKP